MLIFGAILLLTTLALYAGFVANACNLHSSDPAGNALASAFGLLMGIALWILLSILLFVAACLGEMSSWSAVIALLLTPASCAAALAAHKLLEDRHVRTVKWPLIVLALVPALIIAFAVWTAFPSLHARLAPMSATLAFWSPIAFLSIIPWLVLAKRSRERARISNEV